MTTTSQLIIRSLRKDDLASLPAMIKWFGYDVPHNLTDLLDDVLARPDAAGLVAEIDGRAVGYALLVKRVTLSSPRPVVWLEELSVLEAGKGIGSKLLAAAEQWARKAGGGRLALTNRRSRESFKRGFYPKHGYAELDAAVFYKPLEGDS